MKYIKVTAGSVCVATVIPISEWIDESAGRKFVDEGYIEIDESIEDDEVLDKKYDPSAEESSIKTADSFTSPGVDSNGYKRWYNHDDGNNEQR